MKKYRDGESLRKDIIRLFSEGYTFSQIYSILEIGRSNLIYHIGVLHAVQRLHYCRIIEIVP